MPSVRNPLHQDFFLARLEFPTSAFFLRSCASLRTTLHFSKIHRFHYWSLPSAASFDVAACDSLSVWSRSEEGDCLVFLSLSSGHVSTCLWKDVCMAKKKKMWSLFENVIRRSELLLHLVYCMPRNRTISIFHGQCCSICTLHVFCYLSHPCLLEGSFAGGCRVTYEPVSLALFTGPSFHSADFIILAIVKELCLYMQPLLSVLLYFCSCNYKIRDAL